MFLFFLCVCVFFAGAGAREEECKAGPGVVIVDRGGYPYLRMVWWGGGHS